jgi:hypothetical protein
VWGKQETRHSLLQEMDAYSENHRQIGTLWSPNVTRGTVTFNPVSRDSQLLTDWTQRMDNLIETLRSDPATWRPLFPYLNLTTNDRFVLNHPANILKTGQQFGIEVKNVYDAVYMTMLAYDKVSFIIVVSEIDH